VSREIPIVEGLQLAAADEPALAGVLTEYLFEIVGVLRDRLLGDPDPRNDASGSVAGASVWSCRFSSWPTLRSEPQFGQAILPVS